MSSLEISIQGPAQGALSLLGCKSHTNRALICAAFAAGESILQNPSLSDDSRLMVENLKRLGVGFQLADREWRIHGLGDVPRFSKVEIQVENAGTVLRFLLPFLCSGYGNARVSGSKRMRNRPIQPLCDSLSRMGASIVSDTESAQLQLTVSAQGLLGGRVPVATDQSSQFLSGLLLASPYYKESAAFESAGAFVSEPYLEMTRQVQAQFGISQMGFESSPGKYRAIHYVVPGDPSAAFIWMIAVALAGGELLIRDQLDSPLLQKLAGFNWDHKLGYRLERGADGVRVAAGPFKPVDADLTATPDLAPFAVVASLFAKGKSRFIGLPHLRGKESDRLSALVTELSKCGASLRERSDGIEVEGGLPLHAATLHSYEDHRLAMAFALLSARVPGITILDPDCVSKSYPNFFEILEGLFDKLTLRKT